LFLITTTKGTDSQHNSTTLLLSDRHMMARHEEG
jgi:hypothetical protein